MSLTVKQLRADLKTFRDDAIIINHEAQDFIHLVSTSNGDLIMSTEKPFGYCNRSSGYVYPTSVEDYVSVSPELDENVDFGEFTLPNLDEEEFPNKFGEAVERKSKYKEAFTLLVNTLGDDIPQSLWDKLYRLDIQMD